MTIFVGARNVVCSILSMDRLRPFLVIFLEPLGLKPSAWARVLPIAGDEALRLGDVASLRAESLDAQLMLS